MIICLVRSDGLKWPCAPAIKLIFTINILFRSPNNQHRQKSLSLYTQGPKLRVRLKDKSGIKLVGDPSILLKII